MVAYHLELPGSRGGFLGVDLFFVISGLLITTLLLRERESTGRISLGGFWNRRFRRLVPPLVVMIAAVVAATRAWGVPEQWSSIRGDAVAALGYVANWRFVLDDQSYFETLFAPSPLRHTWSLAVEEQWYLIWPLVVVGLVAWRRRGVAPAVLIATGAVASAVMMAIGYDPADPSTVYYATHTRAQQLLVGALLAWVLHLRPDLAVRGGDLRHRRMAAGALAAFAVAVVVAADDAAWLYRGGFLLVSLVCAALVWAVVAVDGGALPRLAAAPFRWLGTRSYAVYLWHWPVIVFVGAPMGIELGRPALIALQLALTVALAEATHRLVEVPLRNVPPDRPRPVRRRRPAWRTAAAWSVAAAAVVVASFVVLRPPADRVLAAVDSVRPTAVAATTTDNATTDPATVDDATVDDATLDATLDSVFASPGDTTDPAMPDGGAAPAPELDDAPAEPEGSAGEPEAAPTPPPRRLLLFGDSTALAVATRSTITPAIAPGWFAEAHAQLGCAITPGVTVDAGRSHPSSTNEACATWEDDWAASYDIVRPDVSVLMIGAWEVLDHRVDGADLRYPTPAWSDVITTTYRRAIDVAKGPGGTTPVLLVELPCMRQAPNDDFPAEARNDADRVAAFNATLRSIAAADPLVDAVDIGELFCREGEPIHGIGDQTLRYDGVHVTPFGADLVWRWLAERADAVAPVS